MAEDLRASSCASRVLARLPPLHLLGGNWWSFSGKGGRGPALPVGRPQLSVPALIGTKHHQPPRGHLCKVQTMAALFSRLGVRLCGGACACPARSHTGHAGDGEVRRPYQDHPDRAMDCTAVIFNRRPRSTQLEGLEPAGGSLTQEGSTQHQYRGTAVWRASTFCASWILLLGIKLMHMALSCLSSLRNVEVEHQNIKPSLSDL